MVAYDLCTKHATINKTSPERINENKHQKCFKKWFQREVNIFHQLNFASEINKGLKNIKLKHYFIKKTFN